ncbi:glycosyltransferase family 2 protein [Candidatus Nomurabacteria bacterium]|nr:glycosyltransferase family 2 protein [Candidatus Nomurabacteria bacterium]
MRPKFTIIIPTYRRPVEVMRAVKSVLEQTYVDWKLCVVIDDIESNYQELLTLPQHDNRINVTKNDRNLGKNYSLNYVLKKLAAEEFGGYIVYLDDDDWLAPNCLRNFADEIMEDPSLKWLVSNRVIESAGKPVTKSQLDSGLIHYLRDNLLRRKIFGDATHCLHFPTTKNCRYSNRIKNAEEWLYFSQVATIHPYFKYLNSTGTFTYGYGEDGLTAHQSDIRSLDRIGILFKEALAFKILNPYIYIYLCGRSVKTLLFKLRRFFN